MPATRARLIAGARRARDIAGMARSYSASITMRRNFPPSMV
jgi:hypothetical protein